VVTGTDSTSPIEPTSIRTISVDTSSPVTKRPKGWLPSAKNSSRGSEAPAYARTSVLTAEATWSRPTLVASR
jgi:hypothetical protein